MDPIGLTTSLMSVCLDLYKFSNDAIHARKQMRQLSDELSSLQASLKHSKSVLEFAQIEVKENPSSKTWENSRLLSSEYERKLSDTWEYLKSLLDELNLRKLKSFKGIKQTLTWHWKKEEFQDHIDKLERIKTWFIQATTDDNQLLTLRANEAINNVSRTLEAQVQRANLQDATQLQEKVEQWLAPHDTEGFYRQCLKRFEPGVGNWFLSGETYQQWIKGSGNQNRGLWLKANSGFGKTMLLAATVENIQKLANTSRPDIKLAYWFCSFNERLSQKLNNVLGRLIHQLSWSNPDLLARIDERRTKAINNSRNSRSEQLELKELTELLIEVAKNLGPSYLLVDACNESEDARSLIRILSTVLSECPNIHVLISSIEMLEVTKSSFEILRIEKNTNAKDIQLYIEASLTSANGRIETENLWNIEASIKKEIAIALQRRAYGSFRWVDCQLQALNTKRSPKKIRDALHSLPESLEQTYLQVLERIPDGEDRIYRNRLLFWLRYAYRPLELEEICQAVIMDEDEEFDLDARLNDKELVLRLCPSLISYNETEETLTLGHASVYEFLGRSDFVLSSVFKLPLDPKTASGRDRGHAADTRIAEICLSYLMQPEFSSGWVDRDPYDLFQERMKAWPFLNYVADKLWDHLSSADINGPLSSLLRKFLASHKLPRGGNFAAWVQAYYKTLSGYKIEATKPLFWAAREGHLGIARIILDHEGCEALEQPGGGWGSTPLHVACWAGNTNVVRYLIDQGANVYEENDVGETGLFWAKQHGYRDIVKMLEDKRSGL